MVCRLRSICKEKCNGNCSASVGYNLAKFLREVDVVESKIGNLSDGSDYITSGLEIDRDNRCADLLSSVSLGLDASKRFNNVYNKSAISVLNDYIKMENCEDYLELRDRLKKVESSKLLIMPIKPGMNCDVVVDVKNNTTQFKSTRVEVVKWMNNKNNLECVIITDIIGNGDTKRAKVSLLDYGEKIRLTDIERSIKVKDLDRGIIKMSKFGYIKPISLVGNGGTKFIIDNTYLYMLHNEVINKIAYWDKNTLNGTNVYKELLKTEIGKRINNNLDYISKHRRYIAPYGLSECNEI